MNQTDIQKRAERANGLSVLRIDINNYYVESSEKKICYKVFITDDKTTCTCGDYARNSKTNEKFQCKHILAVFNSVNNEDFKSVEFLEKRKPKLDERFIKNIEGKDFVLYSGLLDLAHQKGLLKIEVEILQTPSKENDNLCICKAIATSKLGEVFVDVGDANPTNCNNRVSKHLIRMASTRAKARCLRDMTNIGITALEELEDYNDVIQENPSKTKKRTQMKKQSTAASKKEEKSETPVNKTAKKDKPDEKVKNSPTTEPKMSDAQKRAVMNLSRRRGISVEELENMVQQEYGTNLENLTSKDASGFIRKLQQAS